MTECEKHDELERSIQTHTDLTNRHIKEYDGNQRNELIKVGFRALKSKLKFTLVYDGINISFRNFLKFIS